MNSVTPVKTQWLLKGRLDETGPIQMFSIEASPFVVGRRSGAALTIPRSTISGKHAEIIRRDDRLFIRDLGSTNGTFINGAPLKGEAELADFDLVQFADAAFRVCADLPRQSLSTTMTSPSDACDLAFSLVQFDRLMTNRSVIPYFQPIVAIQNKQVVGYEILGRSNVYGMNNPKEMFLAASQLNLEVELSQLLRMAAGEKSSDIDRPINLFLNTHPAEIVDLGLLESLRDLRMQNPDQRITLEVHEAAVTDVAKMKVLRKALDSLNMELAYDDFGRGQSRLVELAAVRPDYIKFDIALIHEIDKKPESDQRMLESLAGMVKELGITVLAEGVETEGEHEVCRQCGFDLGQGYYYGRPAEKSRFFENAPEVV